MDLLEVPAVLARLRIERDDRGREQVVAGAHAAVVVGAGVARREEDEPELGIDGRGLPDRRAAVHPQIVVLRPRVVTEFAGPGNRVERPDELAALGVERFDAAADAVLRAGEARDDEPIEVERRARDREPVLPALGLHRPFDACRFSDRARRACRRADRRTPCRRQARHRGSSSRSRRRRCLRRDSPRTTTGSHRCRRRARTRRRRPSRRRRHRRRRSAALRPSISCRCRSRRRRVRHTPLRLATLLRSIFVERRIALVVPIAAVRRPIRRRRRNECVALERRCRANRLRSRRHRDADCQQCDRSPADRADRNALFCHRQLPPKPVVRAATWSL